jgi:hypothetical protein
MILMNVLDPAVMHTVASSLRIADGTVFSWH